MSEHKLPNREMKFGYRSEQRRSKALLKSSSLIKDYAVNPYPNRAQRRASAKRAGYFEVNRQTGKNDWGIYRAAGNAQTHIKAEKVAP